MKKLLTLAICAGIISPVFGQNLDITTDNDTGFSNIVVEPMAADFYELITPEGGGLLAYNTFYWDLVAQEFVSSPGASVYFEFQLMDTNPTHMPYDGYMEVGYIGNESGDSNILKARGTDSDLDTVDDTVQDLFVYDVPSWGGAPGSVNPPQNVVITTADGATDPVAFDFIHQDVAWGETSPGTTQSDQNKFKIWEAYAYYNGQSDPHGFGSLPLWLIAIDDRQSELIDYDDGVFIATLVDEIYRVPEPSQVAALALLGLGAFLFIRRRIKK